MAATFVLDSAKTRLQDRAGGSLRRVVVGALTVSGSEGAAALDIAASLFGLNIIEEALPLVKDDNTLIVTAAPAYNGLSLLGKAAGTAAPANIPAGTYAAVVKGT